MDTLTLFDAYKKAASHKRRASDNRRSIQGIACNSDHFALQWQRWDRLVRKLNVKIPDALGRERRWDVCAMCGWHQPGCACREFVPMCKGS